MRETSYHHTLYFPLANVTALERVLDSDCRTRTDQYGGRGMVPVYENRADCALLTGRLAGP